MVFRAPSRASRGPGREIYLYIYIPSLKLKIHVVKVGVEQDRAGGTAPCWVHVQHSWENMAIATSSKQGRNAIVGGTGGEKRLEPVGLLPFYSP